MSKESRFEPDFPIFEVEPRIIKIEDRSKSTIGPHEFFEDSIRILGVEAYIDPEDLIAAYGRPREKTTRKPGHGIYVEGKCHLFRTKLFPNCLFSSDEFRGLVEQHHFSGIDFLEVGNFI